MGTVCVVSATPLEEELLVGWESDCLPSESFFDEDPAEDVDVAHVGEAALIAKPWVLDAPAGAFTDMREGLSLLVEAAKLLSGMDIIFRFVGSGDAAGLFEIPSAGADAGAAEAAGSVPCRAP